MRAQGRSEVWSLGMIIRRSLTPLNSSATVRAVRQCETVGGSDDDSRRKLQNVPGDSSRQDSPSSASRRAELLGDVGPVEA